MKSLKKKKMIEEIIKEFIEQADKIGEEKRRR